MKSFLTALLLASLTALQAADVADNRHAATQAPPRPDYLAFTQSYRVPFANRQPVDFDKLQTMLVRVSINGGPVMLMQVDTGSTGVIAGGGDVPGIAPDAPAGSIHYSSSGVELKGVWTPGTLTFLDAKDAEGNPATALVPVLAVHERVVHEGAVNSGSFKSTKNPKIYMFGVGSGRGKEPHQEKNPFLNLKEMQAARCGAG